jgi:hypothetical protein
MIDLRFFQCSEETVHETNELFFVLGFLLVNATSWSTKFVSWLCLAVRFAHVHISFSYMDSFLTCLLTPNNMHSTYHLRYFIYSFPLLTSISWLQQQGSHTYSKAVIEKVSRSSLLEIMGNRYIASCEIG